MKTLWLLSHLRDSPGNRIVLDAAKKRAYRTLLVDPARLNLMIRTKEGGLSLVPDPSLGDGPPDAVLTRLGSSAPIAAMDTLRQLQLMDIPCVNRPTSVRRCRDKVTCFQLLANHNIPMPTTALLGPDFPSDRIAELIPGPPWIVKFPLSTQGTGVILAESLRSLRSIRDAVAGYEHRLLLQQFVTEAAGTDVRVFVIDGKAVAAMRRQASRDEFRSNIHRGGQGTVVELTDELRTVAERSVEILDLQIAGVDLLLGPDGPLLIEVNSSPGLENIQTVTQTPIADRILDLIEAKAGWSR
ncbi:MAG: RimK family alpha-L-glutamate ligase [Myxococcales bacterium]|nr:RimK family alpha-L-glutamate ligase [Myxococcales bacterium]